MKSHLADAGLEQATVFDLRFDAEGDLWLASSIGLLCYDGYFWTTAEGVDGLVRCVLPVRDGRLWIGADDGAGELREGRLLPAAELARTSVSRIADGPEGALWFCCDPGPDADAAAARLLRLDADGWTRFGVREGLPAGRVQDVVFDDRGRPYAATRRGVARLEGERFRRVQLGAGGGHGVRALSPLPGGGLLAAADGGYFASSPTDGDALRWAQVAPPTSGPTRPRLALVGEELFSCRVGPRSRFLRWDGAAFVPASKPFATLGEADPADLHVLRAGPDESLWAAGTHLLVRWERTAADGELYPDLPPPALVDTAGAIWFADQASVVRLGRRGWDRIPGAREPLVEDASRAAVWMLADEGIMRWTADGSEHFGSPETGIEAPRALVTDGGGALWARGPSDGRHAPFARYDGERWTQQAVELTSRYERVEYHLPDPEDGVWLVLVDAETGAMRLRKVDTTHGVELAPPAPELADDEPRLCHDRRGRLWFYTRFGLWLLNSHDGSHWSEVELPGRRVVDLHEAEDGLWVASSGASGSGRSHARYGESWTHLSVVGGRVLPRTFSSSDETPFEGLDIPPPPKHFPPAGALADAIQTTGGEVWVGTNAGTWRYPPDLTPPETLLVSPPTRVFAGEPLQLTVRGIERNRPHGSARPFQVAWRWVDEPWGDWEPLHGPLEIPGGPKGLRQIEVLVRDQDGDADRSPAPLTYNVLPTALQDRPWFPAAVIGAVLLVLLLGALALRASRKLRRQARTLEQEVARRTDELAASEQRYRTLFEDSRDAVYLFDLDGALINCNAAAIELSAGRADGAPPARLSNLFSSAAERSLLRGAIEDPAAARSERFRIHDADGVAHDVLLTANPLRERGVGIVGSQVILRDVTRQVELEVKLRQKRKMEALGRMAGGITHDFNNMLTVLRGYATVLESDLRDDPGRRKKAQVIVETSERAIALTQQIQAFSRAPNAEAVVIDTGHELVDILELLRSTVPPWVTLEQDLEAELGATCISSVQLSQVLVNLVQNAAQAMDDGGRVVVRARNAWLQQTDAVAAGVPGGRYVQLDVQDDGPGMAPDVEERIFDPFFTTKPPGQGTGLGLAIVYGIVNQARGGIQVESATGEGSLFRVLLPVSDDRPAESGAGGHHAGERGGGGETVLVVDDEPWIRQLARETLESANYRVRTADSAPTALELLRHDPGEIALLLTDIVMPEVDGIELARRVRGLAPRLPVLLMTGYQLQGPRTELDAPLLQKPFALGELRARVRELLDQSHAAH
ncbi:MAG: ATP-binding protein [Planctomycetota bacterium]